MKNNYDYYLRMIGKYTIYAYVFSAMLFTVTLANSGSAQGVVSVKDAAISLELSSEPLVRVFEEIEHRTNYVFVYDPDQITVNHLVSLKSRRKTQTVEQILLDISRQTNLRFRQVNDRISVRVNRGDLPINDIEVLLATVPVNGTVTDENGEPLPGATIIEKGTTNGTTTDLEGRYKLDVQEGATLIISFVGYVINETSVQGRTQVDVSLQPDQLSLQEIIVVGYGTQKKKTLTGSVSAVDGEELQKTPIANVAANLQGRLPGLTANQRTGEPGRDDPNILIRGMGTFGNNDPLIIIDGVPRANIGRLNPADVENVSVLKDASAAIYGARAANGVILVTTKSGKSGKPVFNFSYETAISNPTQLPEVLDAATYAEIYNEGEWYAQGRPAAADFSPFYSDEAIEKFRDGSDPILYPNTNWAKESLKKSPMQQRMSLSATGGTDNIRYLLSFAYLDQEGHYKNNPTNYEQYNMRAKVDVDLTENLTVGANLSGIINKKEYPSEGTWVNFYNILRALPTIPAVYPNGMIAPGRFAQNPLLLDRRGYKQIDETPLYTTFTGSYDLPFIEGLRLDASFNYDLDNHTDKTWQLPYMYNEYDVNTGEYNELITGPPSPILTDRYDKFTTMMFNFRLNYEVSLGDHNITAMVGQEQQKNKHSWIQAWRQNFVSSSIDQINAGSTAPEDRNNAGTTTESAYNNFFGRLNYDYRSKYLVEFLFRYDGSQIFPDGERYGFFPGVSAGWRLSEEPFIKDNLNFVDNLKLRFSHGKIGNDRVPQWQYLQAFTFVDNYVFGSSDVPGVRAGTLPNPGITWETSQKTDVGLEAEFIRGLIGLEATLWKENRSNILAARNLSIPHILGFPGLPDENIGEVDAKGFELIMTHQNTIDQIKYSISGNVAHASSKIVFMDETPNTEEYQNQTGKPVSSALYYKTDGIFNTQEELDSYPHRGSTQLGDLKIVDLNDDGVIDANDRYRHDKTATPEWVFGLNTSLTYQSFDLSVFFQGQAGAVNYATRFEDLGTTEPANAYVARAEDRWTVDNPNGTMPRARHDNPGDNTFFLYDATFIRLKSAEIGYSLPNSLTSKIRIDNLRFYVSGSNLLTWAKEIKFTDPEVNGQSIYYPQLRVVNFGVNVKF